MSSATVIPQRPLAEVGVGVGADVEGVLPGEVEGDRLDGLGVGGVAELLEDEGADDGVEVLGGAVPARGEKWAASSRTGRWGRRFSRKTAAQERSRSLRRFSPRWAQVSKRSPVW